MIQWDRIAFFFFFFNLWRIGRALVRFCRRAGRFPLAGRGCSHDDGEHIRITYIYGILILPRQCQAGLLLDSLTGIIRTYEYRGAGTTIVAYERKFKEHLAFVFMIKQPLHFHPEMYVEDQQPEIKEHRINSSQCS